MTDIDLEEIKNRVAAATRAGYTSHGHPIAGLKQSGKPSSVMRCGGPRICARCALEASRATSSTLLNGLKGGASESR